MIVIDTDLNLDLLVNIYIESISLKSLKIPRCTGTGFIFINCELV